MINTNIVDARCNMDNTFLVYVFAVLFTFVRSEEKLEICNEFLKDKQIAHQLSWAGAVSTPCPCDESTISLDGSFKKSDKCYQEWFFDKHGLKQMCCYSDNGKLLIDPPFGGYLSLSTSSRNISAAHTACCSEKSKKCALFYNINPSDDCSRYKPPDVVKTWGDPTITTIDEFQYDFNGHGEYNFLSTGDLEIQARTEYAISGNIDATMFTAFVIYRVSSGDQYEFHFDSISKVINVYKHGKRICNSSGDRPAPCGTVDPKSCFILAGKNKVIVQGCVNIFSEQILFSADGFMSIEITKNDKSSELNFSGLAEPRHNGTLALRNRSLVNENSSASYLFDFGESWALQNKTESRFNYNITGKNFTFYNSAHTRPKFLEDLVNNLTALFPHVPKEDVDKYNATCRNYWNKEPNKQCLLTIARTGNYSFGLTAMKEVNETRLAWERTHNQPPSFSEEMPDKLRVVLKESNSTYKMDLNNYVNDTDIGDTFRFTVDTNIAGYEIDKSGEFVWTLEESLKNLTSLDIKFYVYDKFNFSASHTLIVNFCGCEHGLEECDFSGENNDTGVVAKCKCSKYYKGEYCEQSVDPCSVTKCFMDRCNSSAPVGEDPCEPCPEGYNGDGRICSDVDECESTYNGTDKCEQNCSNTAGSFICDCKSGYTLNNDNYTCSDIDECADEKLKCNGSKELCVNTAGSFHCACETGNIRTEGRCETIKATNQYVGSMNFSITAVMVSMSLSEVNTLENREAVNEEMNKWFNGTKGYVAVEIYKLQMLKPSRRKRAASSGSTKLVADFIIHGNNETGGKSVRVAIEDSYQKYKSDHSSMETIITVNGEKISVRPGVLSIQTSSAFGMCNITGRTDCDHETTTCKNIDGGFECPCLSGFTSQNTSRKACVDVDECKLYNDTKSLEQKCSRGSCRNTVGNWTCECPTELLLQSFANTDGVLYRCQGNFSYIGNISILTTGTTEENLTDAILEYMMKSYRNESFESKEHTIPISNLFVDTTVLTLQRQANYSNGSSLYTSIFNLRMGEVIDVQRVGDVLTKAVDANPYFSGKSFYATIVSAHIFTDEENMLCVLSNNSDCDLSTTSCQQGNASTSCECLVGHDRKNNVSCEAKNCGALSNPDNGWIELNNNNTIFNSSATFGCNEGFYLDGDRGSLCTSSGLWSSKPSCLLWDCGVPTTPDHGSVEISNTTYGSTANFSCDKGYHLINGERYSECDSNGNWTSTPTCVIYDCRMPTTPDNGSVKYLNTTYGSTANFSCDKGYYLINGEGYSECDSNGNWTSTPTCSIYDCGQLKIQNSIISLPGNKTTYGSVANISCAVGYNLIGDSQSDCNFTGQWTGEANCTIKDCGSLTDPDNGKVEFSNTTYGSSANFSCNEGHELINGDRYATCGSNGTWTSSPICLIVDCGSLTDPDNGTVKFSNTTYGSSANFSCNEGYELINGDRNATCGSNGNWTSSPICNIRDCGPLKIGDGIISLLTNKTIYGAVANISCAVGYNLYGANQSHCNSSGQWSGETNCTITDCGRPLAPQYGRFTTKLDNTTYKTRAEVECDVGYSISGAHNFSECESDGNWTTMPICTILDCGPLNIKSNGHVYLTDGNTTYNSSANFDCDTGYGLTTDNYSICNSSGEWTNRPQCQFIDCGNLTVENGIVYLNDSRTTKDARASTQCGKGFVIIGKTDSICNATGQWSRVPTCTKIDCGNLTDPDHGHVTVANNITTYKSSADFSCDEGYYIKGDYFSICKSDGNWSNRPSCTIRNCGPLVIPGHGHALVTNTTFNSSATFACDLGYKLTTVNYSYCNSSGRWTHKPTCIIQDCKSPKVANGSFILNDGKTTYGSTAYFTCSVGYDLYGNASAICNEVGTWMSSPSCVIKDCGDINITSNGSAIFTNTTFGSTATFTCDIGYELNSENISTCNSSGLWTNKPDCIIQDCKDPNEPENGHVYLENNTTTYLSVARFECDIGYELSNNNLSVCESSGNWSTIPSCIKKDCGQWSNADNINVSYKNNDTHYGSTAQALCLPGFYFNGTDKVQTANCTEDKTWSQPVPICKILDCGEPKIDNGMFAPQTTTYRSTVNFTCNAGYDIEGYVSAICDEFGNWTTLPSCVIKDCKGPNEPENGHVYLENSTTTYLSVARFECDIGYELSNNNLSVCDSSGNWSTIPSCIKKDCGQWSNADNINVTYKNNDTHYGSTAQALCLPGFYFNGTGEVQTANCTEDKTWSQPVPICEIIDCGEPKIDNGMFAPQTTTYRSTVNFTCNAGYDIEGYVSAICDEFGNWTTLPSCVIKDCKDPNEPENGHVYLENNTTTYLSIARFECEFVEYELSNNNLSVCESSGNWSTIPSCIKKDCGQWSNADNINVTYKNNDTHYGSTAQALCLPGYYFNGTDEVQTANCTEDKTWSQPVPICEILDCGEPKIDNGMFTPQTTTYGSIVNFTCNAGYDMEGDASAQCNEFGNWTTLPSCVIKDCKRLEEPENGHVYLENDTTTYKSIARFECAIGYELSGKSISVCESSGNWSTIPFCKIMDCGKWIYAINISVTYDKNSTQYGSTAHAQCPPGFHLKGSDKLQTTAVCTGNKTWSQQEPTCVAAACNEFSEGDRPVITYSSKQDTNGKYAVNTSAMFDCTKGYNLNGVEKATCQSSGNWNEDLPSCVKAVLTISNCPKSKGANKTWEETKPGILIRKDCPKGYGGSITRQCSLQGVWKKINNTCVRLAIKKLTNEVEALKNTTVPPKTITNILVRLENITEVSETETETHVLKGAEIVKVTSILSDIVTISEKNNVTQNQSQSFLDTASNVLDVRNKETFTSVESNEDETNHETKAAVQVLDVVSRYTDVVAKTLNETKSHATITAKNLVMHVRKISKEKEDIKFPTKEHKNLEVKSSVSIPKESLPENSNFSAVIYKSLGGIMPTGKEFSKINSDVMSINIGGWNGVKDFKLNMTFTHSEPKSERANIPHCSFWDESSHGWNTSGCTLVSSLSNNNQSICECHHLTNFAILMSPWIPPSDAKALDIISITGCSLSLLGLIITVIMHIVLWRHVKSDRVVILMNLCIALILSYAIFLGGVDRTEDKDACTVVAVLLQYIYLVVFFLMLAEGIELAVTILYVFSTRSRLKWLLPLAWFLPAMITAVSVGSSQTEGYGNDQFCWLSIDGGLIWAFVAPVLTIIIINFVLLILVMRAMFNAQTLSEKSISLRARTGVRCLCVLLPLMGITWVFGIFYVNDETVWIQYVFAVCNSLQGFVIFIFHCALNTQIRRGIQRKHKQYTDTMQISKSSTFAIPRVNKGTTQFNMIYALDSEIPPDYDITEWRRSSLDMPSFQRIDSIDDWKRPRSSAM